MLALSTGEYLGYSAALFYTLFYVLLSINVFQGLFLFRKQRGKELIVTLSELKSVSRALPLAAALFSLTFFSFAGVPPLAGFFTKMYVIQSLIDVGALSAIFFVIVFSILSLFIMFVLLK